VFVIVKVIVFWVPTVTLWKFALDGLKERVPCVAAAARSLRTAERIVELNKVAQRIPRKKRNACLETRGPGPYFCIPVAGYGGGPFLTTGRKHSYRPASFVCLGTRLPPAILLYSGTGAICFFARQTRAHSGRAFDFPCGRAFVQFASLSGAARCYSRGALRLIMQSHIVRREIAPPAALRIPRIVH
jgi:hypothetical protein